MPNQALLKVGIDAPLISGKILMAIPVRYGYPIETNPTVPCVSLPVSQIKGKLHSISYVVDVLEFQFVGDYPS